MDECSRFQTVTDNNCHLIVNFARAAHSNKLAHAILSNRLRSVLRIFPQEENGTVSETIRNHAVMKHNFSTATQSPWTVAALVFLTFALAYLRGFVFPHTPILFWGDQLGFATKGTWILAGRLPYRDFFEFVTPGTSLTYALLFRAFGVSIWVPNLTMTFLAAVTVFIMTLCARSVVRRAFIVLPALLFVGFVLHDSLDATHHWFSTVAIMLAILVLLDDVSPTRIATVGVLCGLAATFTQSTGAAATIGFLVYLIWRSSRDAVRLRIPWRDCLLLLGMTAAVFLAINGPLILAAGVNRWIASVIVFPVRYFGSVSNNRFGGSWIEFVAKTSPVKWIVFPFMYATVLLVYIAFFWVMCRNRTDRTQQWDNQPWDKLLLIAIVGVAMFISIAPAPSIKRISAVSPPAMVLFAWLFSRGTKGVFWAAGALGVLSFLIALTAAFRAQTHRYRYIDLPAGRAALPDKGIYDLYAWMALHTRPGQWYFGMPPFYLPLELRDPAPVEAPTPGEYGRPEQIAAAIRGVEAKRVPLMVLRPILYVPHLSGAKADHLQPFEDYLFTHYRHTKTFSTGDEVWVRRDTPSPSSKP